MFVVQTKRVAEKFERRHHMELTIGLENVQNSVPIHGKAGGDKQIPVLVCRLDDKKMRPDLPVLWRHTTCPAAQTRSASPIETPEGLPNLASYWGHW